MTTAKLFMNGRSQAIRLPKEYRFNNEETVMIKRMGDILMLVPMSKWKELFTSAIKEFPADVDLQREGNKLPAREVEL